MIPSFALVSVVGAGFATWYWTEEQNMSVDAGVTITDEVTSGFSVAVSNSKTGVLVLDQKNNNNHPETDKARGVFLSTTDWEKTNFAGADGLALTVTHNGGDVTGTATLHCIASWTGETAKGNAATYLSLTTTELNTALTFSDGGSGSYTDEITVGANSGDINLGIDYVEGKEPTRSEEYKAMDTALDGLGLNLTFYVTVA